MPNRFFILACDGGGIRGLASATVLAALEKRLQDKNPGKPLYEYFGLVAGTSTGSIIACGLSNGSSAEKIQRLYHEQGINIFPEFGVTFPGIVRRVKQLGNLLRFDISEPIYQDVYDKERGLNIVLQQELGAEAKFSELKVQTLVTSYDTFNQHFVLFDSHKLLFQQINVWEVARSSSAAPIAFPAHLLKEPKFIQTWEQQGYRTFEDTQGQKCIPLIDGGLAAGNPSVCAIAQRLSQSGANIDEIFLVSLGTGINPKPDKPPKFSPKQRTSKEARGWGLVEWASLRRSIPILRATFDGAADATDFQARQLLPDGHYFRFQPQFNREYQSFNANPDVLNCMIRDTENYLQIPTVAEQLDKLVELLLQGG